MLKISNITYSIGGQTIFDHINFIMPINARVALIGDNGTGKTTLLRLIKGELAPDDGAIETGGNVAYVPQHSEDESLSGGQVTQRAIERAIYHTEKSQLLLLDEPTNNLDVGARDWLVELVRRFEGQVLFASHDRAFINQVATHVLEIRNGGLELYTGDYDAYREIQEQRRREQQLRYEKVQNAKSKLLRQLHYAKSTMNHANHARFDKIKSGDMKMQFNTRVDNAQASAGKNIHAISNKLDQIEKVDKPSERKIYGAHLDSVTKHDKVIVAAHNISKSYDGKKVLDNISLELRTSERMRIAGKNGSGKSTLLRIIAQQIGPDEGGVKLPDNLKFGYVSQDITNIDLGRTGLENLETVRGDKTEIYRAASSMDLSPEDLGKLAGTLSRGQITKLAVIKLLFRPLDLILLDELTNHIDIRARENIENAFREYEGALMVASHDDYFVEGLGVDRVVEL